MAEPQGADPTTGRPSRCVPARRSFWAQRPLLRAIDVSDDAYGVPPVVVTHFSVDHLLAAPLDLDYKVR